MTDPHVTRILDAQTPAIRALVNTLRGLIHQAAPALTEYGQEKMNNIMYKGEKIVVNISPYKAHVNVYFYQGVKLDDPQGLLQGKGGQLRHLKYSAPEEIDAEVLRGFIVQALQVDTAG